MHVTDTDSNNSSHELTPEILEILNHALDSNPEKYRTLSPTSFKFPVNQRHKILDRILSSESPRKQNTLYGNLRKYMPKKESSKTIDSSSISEEPEHTIWLFDTENEASRHYAPYEQIQDGDEVWWLWTFANQAMPLNAIQAFSKHHVNIHVAQARKGQNALDFQIMTLLGYLIATHAHTQKYIIVTNDEGFDAAVCFWRARNFDVTRQPYKSQNRSPEHIHDFSTQFIPTTTVDELIRKEYPTENVKPNKESSSNSHPQKKSLVKTHERKGK